ncbi:MAG: hypothetical protein ACKVI3_02085, partial [Verrucomicrobiia bacterium]
APSKPGPSRPSRPTSYYDLEDLVRFVRKTARTLYESSGNTMPSINVVGYSPNAKGTAVIEELADIFPEGSHRLMGGFDESVTQ